jgi:hypothetical protein
MTDQTTRRPRRRRRAAMFAVLFLLVGLGLLLYSATYLTSRSSNPSNAGPPRPSISLSPVAVPADGTPTPGDTTPTPRISYVTVTVPVPVQAPPAAPVQETGWLPLVTTLSGLVASVAGIVSAFVSMRRTR